MLLAGFVWFNLARIGGEILPVGNTQKKGLIEKDGKHIILYNVLWFVCVTDKDWCCITTGDISIFPTIKLYSSKYNSVASFNMQLNH